MRPHVVRGSSSSTLGRRQITTPAIGKPPQLRPDEILEIARARLGDSVYSALRQVTCQYDAGSLVLAGRLPSFFHKQLAQEALAHIEAGVRIDNQTEVVELKDA